LTGGIGAVAAHSVSGASRSIPTVASPLPLALVSRQSVTRPVSGSAATWAAGIDRPPILRQEREHAARPGRCPATDSESSNSPDPQNDPAPQDRHRSTPPDRRINTRVIQKSPSAIRCGLEYLSRGSIRCSHRISRVQCHTRQLQRWAFAEGRIRLSADGLPR
jgi:hypothetical protein